MESGLEDRNNLTESACRGRQLGRLNGVRPRRPEQCSQLDLALAAYLGSQWSPA